MPIRNKAGCWWRGRTEPDGLLVWAICDRGPFAPPGAKRFGWWVRNNRTMNMGTGETHTLKQSARKAKAAIARLRAS